MKSQLLKLYAVALIIGIVAVGSAFAQQTLQFNVPFDFQIGKEKLDAGKYEMLVLSNSRYLLKSVETNEKVLISSNIQVGNERSVKSEKLVFNRYGDTYFLRQIFARPATVGTEITETKAERNVRNNFEEENLKIADNKSKPEKVSINSAQ